MRAFTELCSEEFKQHFYNFSVTKNNNTRNEYISYINMLCNHASKDFMDITYEDAQNFLNYMNNKRSDGKLTRKTIAVRLACYNSVAQYIEERDDDYKNVFSRLSRPEVTQEFDPNRIPSMSDLDKLFSEAKKDSQDFLILALATRVGLSATSILRLTTKSVMENEGKVYLHFEPKGDFDKDTYVLLPDDVKDILKKHLSDKYLSTDSDEPLFINKWKRKLSIQNVDQLIKRLTTVCGLEEYTLKDFRNRAILEMANAGATKEQLENYTGLKALRLEKFFLNKGLVKGECPANLVNYRLLV